MIQRLLLLCALVALASESAYGVGLGKVELHSALNQRLDADIPLTNTQGLSTEEILPSLASTDEFDKLGLDRPYELIDLRFSVVQGKDGQMAVHITTTKPVVEPFLDFLVEVLWPNGRLVREYTVLLDPPVFGKGGVQELNAAKSGAPAQMAEAPANPKPAATASQSSSVAMPASSSNHLEEGTSSEGQYGVTGPGDTLWKIAIKVRPTDSVSLQQTMLAIKRANPDAFINDNINLLKAGRVLRIPDLADIRQVASSDAVRQVKAQNEAFQAYKSGSQVAEMDASRRTSSQASSSSSKSSSELRLTTSNQESSGGTSSGNTGGAASQELQDQLAASKEELDKTKRANTELNGRVGDLEDQIKKLNELVKIKDDQLAALKAAVQKMQASAPAASTQNATTPKRSGSLLTNPYVLIALGILLVGGVAGGLIFMRRRRSNEFEEDEFADTGLPAAQVVEEESEVTHAGDAAPVAEEEEELTPQTSDAVGEAEIYIAYGRFPQAITFLQNAVEAEPTRTDIRLKLLEVFMQTEDTDGFNTQFEELEAIGDESAVARARALKQQFMGGGEPDTDTAAEEDLSFDLDDLDAETAEDNIELGDLGDGEEMDLDLNLDEDEADEPEISLDDTDLDLDLEADSTEDAEDDALSLDDADLEGADLDIELETAAETGTEEDGLSLDLDGDDEIDLDLGDDEELDLSEDLNLDDDGAIELNLEDDDDDALDLSDAGELSLEDDDAIELDLDDDDGIELDLEDDSDAALDLSDDDGLELNLDEDASTKLDLARAYIDMGDNDGARSVLKEVIDQGTDTDIQEANELLAKID